jgi:hypothetical protein
MNAVPAIALPLKTRKQRIQTARCHHGALI